MAGTDEDIDKEKLVNAPSLASSEPVVSPGA